MKTYTTVQGDMWDSIAYSQLSGTEHTHELMNANLEYREYYVFPAGIVLSLPEVTESASANLPPWKQGAG